MAKMFSDFASRVGWVYDSGIDDLSRFVCTARVIQFFRLRKMSVSGANDTTVPVLDDDALVCLCKTCAGYAFARVCHCGLAD